jgi:hypothetical protein
MSQETKSDKNGTAYESITLELPETVVDWFRLCAHMKKQTTEALIQQKIIEQLRSENKDRLQAAWFTMFDFSKIGEDKL